MTIEAVLLAGACYLLGSIPFGFLVGKARGIDLRQVGSGNIGSTNIYRALGLPTALGVFALDAGKGLAATRLVPVLRPGVMEGSHLGFICGIAVIVGSVASIFMRFRGGKGVATAAGVFLGLAPLPAAICIALWAGLVAAFRYVSLGSLAASIALPALLAAFQPAGYARSPVFYLAVAVTLVVVVRHRSNIKRLLQGREHKVGRAAKSSGDQPKESA